MDKDIRMGTQEFRKRYKKNQLKKRWDTKIADETRRMCRAIKRFDNNPTNKLHAIQKGLNNLKKIIKKEQEDESTD